MPPNLSEEPAQQATCKIIHNSTAKRPVGKSRCLTELVAAGKCHRVGNGQNKGDAWMIFISIKILQSYLDRRGHWAQGTLTNETQPDDANQSHDSQNGQSHPQSRGQIQAQPEEPLVCGSDCSDVGVGGFEDPVRVAGGCVDFIPPPKTNKSTPSNVLEVIEVGGEEEESQNKDQNAG